MQTAKAALVGRIYAMRFVRWALGALVAPLIFLMSLFLKAVTAFFDLLEWIWESWSSRPKWLLRSALQAAVTAVIVGSLLLLAIISGPSTPPTRSSPPASQVPSASPVEKAQIEIAAKATAVAEEALYWTKIGTLAGGAGSVLLIVTLVFTAQATRASTENAQVARAAVEFEKTNAVRTLRPYVHVVRLQTACRTQPDNAAKPLVWAVSVEWQNVGSTPAEDVSAGFTMATFDTPMSPDYDFPDLVEPFYVGVIGPGLMMHADATIPPETLVEVAQGRKHLHAWAWVEYESALDGSRHRTEWHAQIVPFGDPSTVHAVLRNSVQRRFNGADRYCLRPPRGLLRPTGGGFRSTS